MRILLKCAEIQFQKQRKENNEENYAKDNAI